MFPLETPWNTTIISKKRDFFDKKRRADEAKFNQTRSSLKYIREADKYLTRKTGKDNYTLEDVKQVKASANETRHGIAMQIAKQIFSAGRNH